MSSPTQPTTDVAMNVEETTIEGIPPGLDLNLEPPPDPAENPILQQAVVDLAQRALRLTRTLHRERKRSREEDEEFESNKRVRVTLEDRSDDTISIPEKFEVGVTRFEKLGTAAINDEYEAQGYAKVGSNQKGLWVDDIVDRTTRSFEGERDAQIMRHVATAFYELAKRRVASEQEVQAMLVNGRLLLGSNEAASMRPTPAQLVGLLNPQGLSERSRRVVRKLKSAIGGGRIDRHRLDVVRQLKARALAELDDNGGDEAAAEDALRIDDEYVGLLDELASWDVAQEIADSIAAGLENGTAFVQCDIGQAAAFIDDNQYAGAVAMVSGLDKVHAELNLVLAYGMSGQPPGAKVYGKKRPCMACFLTLQYASEKLSYGLTYNEHPGGLYTGNLVKVMRALLTRMTTDDLERVHREALDELDTEGLTTVQIGEAQVGAVFGDVARGLPDQQFRTDDDNYDTGSDSGYSSSVESEASQDTLDEFDMSSDEEMLGTGDQTPTNH